MSRLSLDIETALIARGARRHGRHVRFSCVAHDDHHPSADFDPEREVWYCRACHAGGGVHDLARRLGLEKTSRTSHVFRPRRVPAPPPGVTREDWELAWVDVLDLARRQARRLEPYRDLYAVCDWLRLRRQVVADARRVVTTLGEDDPRAWRVAELAARVETVTSVVEAALDAVRRDVAA
jgi:hypothetical protein